MTLSQSGTFEGVYPLSLGKNVFDVQAIGNDGKVAAQSRIRILRMASFKDLPNDYWAKDSIENLATLKMIGGYPDGNFKPEKNISRAELTALLIKSKSSATPEGTDTKFKDVNKKNWASYYISESVMKRS